MDLSDPPVLYALHKLLPTRVKLHNLEWLDLENISTTSGDLLYAVLYQTPNIRYLGVGDLNLLEGSWESFFEALAQTGRLASLRFEYDTFLHHHNGLDFWDDNYPSTLYEDLEQYVVFGGRHPYLFVRQPDSAARTGSRISVSVNLCRGIQKATSQHYGKTEVTSY